MDDKNNNEIEESPAEPIRKPDIPEPMSVQEMAWRRQDAYTRATLLLEIIHDRRRT